MLSFMVSIDARKCPGVSVHTPAVAVLESATCAPGSRALLAPENGSRPPTTTTATTTSTATQETRRTLRTLNFRRTSRPAAPSTTMSRAGSSRRSWVQTDRVLSHCPGPSFVSVSRPVALPHELRDSDGPRGFTLVVVVDA